MVELKNSLSAVGTGFSQGYRESQESRDITFDSGHSMGYKIGETIDALKLSFKFRGLRQAREDLQKRGINIEDLEVKIEGEAINGRKKNNLRDVLHPLAVYNLIERVRTEECAVAPNKMVELKERDSSFNRNYILYDLFKLRVQGTRPGFLRQIPFDVLIHNRPRDFANVIGERLDCLEKLESYFNQRMESQQPQYNYTYRSRTEI